MRRVIAVVSGFAAVFALMGVMFTAPAFAGDNVLTCGWNLRGQLGIGTLDYNAHPTFSQVTGIDGVVAITGGNNNHFAIKSDGTLWAWGDNGGGQLGNGDSMHENKYWPVQVSGLSDVVAVDSNNLHTVALKSDGTVWAWGGNCTLGNGTNDSSDTPVQVKGEGGSGYLTGVVAIAPGNSHSVAAKSDGTVWAWGDNDSGQLGDGTTTTRYTPVQVKGEGGSGYLTDVVSVSAAEHHSVVLKSDGTVWAWGRNNYGQLGDGSTTNRDTPVQVVDEYGYGITDVVAVSTGENHVTALKSDGTVWAWGSNDVGQLGDDSTTDSDTPVQVKGEYGSGFLTGIVSVSAGDRHTIALDTDGTVWGWGNNWLGQLGDGNYYTTSDTPVQASGISGVVVDVAASYQNTAVLSIDCGQ